MDKLESQFECTQESNEDSANLLNGIDSHVHIASNILKDNNTAEIYLTNLQITDTKNGDETASKSDSNLDFTQRRLLEAAQAKMEEFNNRGRLIETVKDHLYAGRGGEASIYERGTMVWPRVGDPHFVQRDGTRITVLPNETGHIIRFRNGSTVVLDGSGNPRSVRPVGSYMNFTDSW
jgi:hypothetical protein